MAEKILEQELMDPKCEEIKKFKSQTFTEEEYEAERSHFLKVTNAFMYYR